MTLQELPMDVQEQLRKDRLALKNKNTNGAYRIRLWSNDGTRYFFADRKQNVWGEWRGKPIFDGHSYWHIRYGRVEIKAKRMWGDTFYELCNGVRFKKSRNGVEIPEYLDKKKDVIELIKKLEIFEL
jgi:hypothetical protein